MSGTKRTLEKPSSIAASLERLTSPSTSNYDRVRASWDAVPTTRIPRTLSDDYPSFSPALQTGEQASQLLKDLENQHNTSVQEGFAVADHLRHTQVYLANTQHEMLAQEKRSRYEKQAILSDWQRDHGALRKAHEMQLARSISAESAASEMGLQTSIMADRQALLKGALDAAHEHIRSTPPAVPLWGFTPRLRPPPVFERPPPHVSAVNHEVEVLRQASLGIQVRMLGLCICGHSGALHDALLGLCEKIVFAGTVALSGGPACQTITLRYMLRSLYLTFIGFI